MWMSDAFAEMMLGHLVCLVQGNAFILVEWAYLGRGKLRWPVLWAELLCMGQLGLSLATGMSFFNVQSVLLNVLYLFVTAQLFGGTFADKLTACLINGTMCLLVENTVNYTYSWFTGVRTGEAWQHTGCLIALCAANLIVGAAVAHSLYSWNQKCALQPLQALVMSFFPGVAVVLNIVLMVTGTQQPATRMTMLLTFGMSVAVLVHIAIVQMFNDQVVQRQNSRYRARSPAGFLHGTAPPDPRVHQPHDSPYRPAGSGRSERRTGLHCQREQNGGGGHHHHGYPQPAAGFHSEQKIRRSGKSWREYLL